MPASHTELYRAKNTSMTHAVINLGRRMNVDNVN